MKRFTVLFTIICVVLICCQQTTVRREKKEVSATVTEMQYEASYTTFMSTYNAATKTTTLQPQIEPSQYLVTITYEGISETFDDKTLYKSVKEGDTIQIILCQDYDEDSNLINQVLQLPE